MTILLGFIGLIIVGLIAFATWVQKRTSPGSAVPGNVLYAYGTYRPTTPPASDYASPGGYTTGAAAPYGYPAHLAYPPPLLVPYFTPPVSSRAHKLYPYGLLLLAFLLYLTIHETISLPLALVLPLLHVRDWSTLMRLRASLLLQLMFYVPVLLLPLWLLWRGAFLSSEAGALATFTQWRRAIGFRTHNALADVAAGMGSYLCLAPVMLLMGYLSDVLFHNYHTPLNPADLEMLAARFPLDKFLVFFVAAVAAPVVEETMFRGILYPALRGKIGVFGGAAVSAAIFSGVHPTLPGGFLPIWAIGFALALLYERRGSLLPGIVLHGLHNGFITLTAFALFAR